MRYGYFDNGVLLKSMVQNVLPHDLMAWRDIHNVDYKISATFIIM